MPASSGILVAAPGIRPVSDHPARLRGTRYWPRLSPPSASSTCSPAVLGEVRGSSLFPLQFRTEHPTGDDARRAPSVSIRTSGRKGSAGVAIVSPRNESRTRRPSLKTIEPHLGHVNERTRFGAGATVLSRYRATIEFPPALLPASYSRNPLDKQKGAASSRSLLPIFGRVCWPPDYCGGGGAWPSGGGGA